MAEIILIKIILEKNIRMHPLAIFFWFLVAYFPISLIYLVGRTIYLNRLKKNIKPMNRYLSGYLELEKLYSEEISEYSKKPIHEIKDEFRRKVIENSDSLTVPDFPNEKAIKEIKKSYLRMK